MYNSILFESIKIFYQCMLGFSIKCRSPKLAGAPTAFLGLIEDFLRHFDHICLM